MHPLTPFSPRPCLTVANPFDAWRELAVKHDVFQSIRVKGLDLEGGQGGMKNRREGAKLRGQASKPAQQASKAGKRAREA